MKFTIYNETGEILRSGTAPADMLDMQVEGNELILKGVAANTATEKIVDGAVVEKEIVNYPPSTASDFRFNYLKDVPAENVDAILSVYFPNIEVWKIANYKALRKLNYPEIEDYVDAHVKIQSIDSVMSAEGTIQLDKYYQDCLAVKIKYPKVKE